MPRHTSAYSSFAAELQEIQLLRSRAGALEKSQPIQKSAEINALCRAAIVLLSAKLEAYVKQLGEITLTNLHARSVSRARLAPQFYYHVSKDVIDEIRDTSDPVKVASKVMKFMQSDGSFWSQTGPFPQPLPVDRFNKGFSTPKVERVQAYLNRFGYSEHKRDIARILKADYAVTVNMVDHVVDVRNKIAHGDPTATKPPADLKPMIAIVRQYCSATDMTFAAWCRSHLCPIR